jgi:glycosyltransferase involved in cell wall biosynthesis
MRIAVAIPCYKGHIQYLKRCLDSIEHQTVRPDEVVVSCSSCTDEDIPEFNYSFPLRIYTTIERKTAAENRNRAGQECSSDILCFFDVDDVMHPQRLEVIRHCFEDDSECGLVLHNYESTIENKPWTVYENSTVHQNALIPNPKTFGVMTTPTAYPIQHGHVSVSKDVFEMIQFSEDPLDDIESGHGKEDSKYCRKIVQWKMCNTAYCFNALSRYIQDTTRSLYFNEDVRLKQQNEST